jgi:hypothetical protein
MRHLDEEARAKLMPPSASQKVVEIRNVASRACKLPNLRSRGMTQLPQLLVGEDRQRPLGLENVGQISRQSLSPLGTNCEKQSLLCDDKSS